MTTSEVTFAPAVLALRPPRVAILFPDDDRWRDWVMRALEVASEHWGGAGFILIPHDAETGEPSPLFADIVRTYDPDHVVTLEVPVQEFEEWYPGSIDVSGVASEEERANVIRSIRDEMTHAASHVARDTVASWCSPMRSARFLPEQSPREHETQTRIEVVDREDRHRRGLPVIPPLNRMVFAASSEWRGDLGLFAAARTGLVRDHGEPRAEPGPGIVEWIVRLEGPGPRELMYTPHPTLQEAEAPTMFGAQPGLMQVSRSFIRDMAAVVVGDTGTDFALALAYDRILGRGYWVSSSMLEDNDVLWRLRSSLWWIITGLRQQASFLCVSSASMDDAEVAAAASMIQEPAYELQRLGRMRQRTEESETVQLRPPRLERVFTELALDEHAGSPVAVPMAVLEDGTLEALSGLDAPVPSSLMYEVRSGKVPYWYVDVAFPRGATPRARDLPSSALLAASDGSFPEVTARSSKEGVSFDPSSLGLVTGGSLLPGRLGRPRLRSLSMRAWIEAMAEAAGLGTRLSAPGRQAELVSRRMGSRNALLDLVSSDALPLLRAFITLERTPSKRKPGTVVIGLDPYLTFDTMTQLLGSEDSTREFVDSLTRVRLLRRGLILGCEECGRVSFVDADHLGQEYACPQCAAPNVLTQARWREGHEPRWHYGLYTPLRDLLRDHGDIPLLAAAHLRRDARSYADTSELEFFEAETGKAVAEIDVIASVNDKVVLVEAKVNGAFKAKERGRQTRKLLRIAEALRADEVVLATSRPTWNELDVAHVTQQATSVRPRPLAASVIVDLGRD